MPNSLSERIYYRMPIPIQHAAVTGHGCWLRLRRYGREFRRLKSWLNESEWWDEDRIRDYQTQRIRETLIDAHRFVPFYRNWLDPDVVATFRDLDDLAKLPILTKSVVRMNQDSMISTRYRRRSLMNGLTSGTTGTPLRVLYTPTGLAFQWAIWWRHRNRFGCDYGDKHLVFGARVAVGGDQAYPPFWRYDLANKRVYVSTFHFRKQHIESVAEMIERERFEFFSGYPSAMYELARLFDESNIAIQSRPRMIFSGSDTLLPIHVSAFENVFGARTTEQYGMVEFAGNMSKCEKGNYHVDFECCLAELIPSEDDPSVLRLVMTGWGNPAMPFIRYEVGDFCQSGFQDCDCGRRSPCVRAINGRLEDYIVTADGRRIVGMNQVVEYATNADAIQLYQPNVNEIEARVVPGAGFGDKDIQAMRREFMRRIGPNDAMQISVKIVDTLERDQHGKVKGVISAV